MANGNGSRVSGDEDSDPIVDEDSETMEIDDPTGSKNGVLHVSGEGIGPLDACATFEQLDPFGGKQTFEPVSSQRGDRDLEKLVASIVSSEAFQDFDEVYEQSAVASKRLGQTVFDHVRISRYEEDFAGIYKLKVQLDNQGDHVCSYYIADVHAGVERVLGEAGNENVLRKANLDTCVGAELVSFKLYLRSEDSKSTIVVDPKQPTTAEGDKYRTIHTPTDSGGPSPKTPASAPLPGFDEPKEPSPTVSPYTEPTKGPTPAPIKPGKRPKGMLTTDLLINIGLVKKAKHRLKNFYNRTIKPGASGIYQRLSNARQSVNSATETNKKGAYAAAGLACLLSLGSAVYIAGNTFYPEQTNNTLDTIFTSVENVFTGDKTEDKKQRSADNIDNLLNDNEDLFVIGPENEDGYSSGTLVHNGKPTQGEIKIGTDGKTVETMPPQEEVFGKTATEEATEEPYTPEPPTPAEEPITEPTTPAYEPQTEEPATEEPTPEEPAYKSVAELYPGKNCFPQLMQLGNHPDVKSAAETGFDRKYYSKGHVNISVSQSGERVRTSLNSNGETYTYFFVGGMDPAKPKDIPTEDIKALHCLAAKYTAQAFEINVGL